MSLTTLELSLIVTILLRMQHHWQRQCLLNSFRFGVLNFLSVISSAFNNYNCSVPILSFGGVQTKRGCPHPSRAGHVQLLRPE